MQDRVKKVRQSLDLSQEAFGKVLGVTKTAICGIEAGRRGLTEHMAKSIVDELTQEFQLDDLDKRIILGYLRLSEADRDAIKRYVRNILDNK